MARVVRLPASQVQRLEALWFVGWEHLSLLFLKLTSGPPRLPSSVDEFAAPVEATKKKCGGYLVGHLSKWTRDFTKCRLGKTNPLHDKKSKNLQNVSILLIPKKSKCSDDKKFQLWNSAAKPRQFVFMGKQAYLQIRPLPPFRPPHHQFTSLRCSGIFRNKGLLGCGCGAGCFCFDVPHRSAPNQRQYVQLNLKSTKSTLLSYHESATILW